MPSHNRSAARDVHIFDASDRRTPIGGLILSAGVTNANLYAMVDIFVIFNSEYVLRNEDDVATDKNNSPLLPGNYYIDSCSTLSLINSSTRLTSKQHPSTSIMRSHWFVQCLHRKLDSVYKHFVMQSVYEIEDALSPGKRRVEPNMISGQASRLHISFRWRMNRIGKISVTAAGFQ